ncbi:hypothetical protein GCM10011579_005790 [Streptomyces albiflavescens]|uniref:Uncharacterized protein n=1 Tax=Streptomyces albiflavescens TaxID=1623582 RepID=A0A917XTM2_9ACTN|nr:hypothetical protein GCM10011579_005790 [Streptomyces albiflavescens]
MCRGEHDGRFRCRTPAGVRHRNPEGSRAPPEQAVPWRELGDHVRAEELAGRLKAARQEATRALHDRTDLYADGGRTLRLGRHRLAVNTPAH